jgi:hypothetical protein
MMKTLARLVLAILLLTVLLASPSLFADTTATNCFQSSCTTVGYILVGDDPFGYQSYFEPDPDINFVLFSDTRITTNYIVTEKLTSSNRNEETFAWLFTGPQTFSIVSDFVRLSREAQTQAILNESLTVTVFDGKSEDMINYFPVNTGFNKNTFIWKDSQLTQINGTLPHDINNYLLLIYLTTGISEVWPDCAKKPVTEERNFVDFWGPNVCNPETVNLFEMNLNVNYAPSDMGFTTSDGIRLLGTFPVGDVPVETPEPKSLLLTGTGILGLLLLCKLRNTRRTYN